ncbi:MAG: ABC transporter ATP-binding protein/permease [bacterium]|nr:ABC transporter ATP-binding protein/permease [bacterium]
MAQNNRKRDPRIADKPKNFKAGFKKLLSILKGHYGWIIFALLLACSGTILTILIPNKIQEFTNIISEAIPILDGGVLTNTGKLVDLNAVSHVALIVCIFIVSSYILSFVHGFILQSVTLKVIKKLRSKLSYKINSLPLSFIDRQENGDILSRITNDIDTLWQGLSESLSTFITSIVQIVGATILMFLTNYILAFCAILSALFGFVFVVLIAKKSQKYFRLQQEGLGKVNGHIEEVYGAHTTIRVNNAQKEVYDKFDNLNNNLYKSAWKSQFLGGLMGPIMGFIGNFGYVVVCVVGAVLVFNGKIDFGVVIAFTIFVRLFSNPLNQIAQVSSSVLSSVAAGERLFEFIDEKDYPNEDEKKDVTCQKLGNVEFKDVCFGYSKEKEIIHNFNCSVKAGQKVAIVGPTGAGKTTIVNLLMRFYEVNSGDILVDGVSIKDMTRDYVHNLFGMVLQDTWIFNGTIKENIIYNQKNVTDKQVEEACVACGLDHFIKSLPNSYDTILDDNTSVSAGQRQLFTIARAMVQNAPMLILDEATSSVDTRTEQMIADAMDNLMKGRTSFVIAHRLSTIKNADLILVLNDGNIVESGTHNSLIEKGGYYKTLYNSQFEEV